MSTPQIAAETVQRPKQVNLGTKSSWISQLWSLDVEDIVNMISSLVYWIVCFLYLILMSFMITIGAYIILFSSLLKMRWMMKAYASLVLILSLWPFVWYTVDQTFVFVIQGLQDSNSGTGVMVAKFLCALLKISLPALGFFASMRAPVSMGAKSMNSIKEGARPVTNTSKMAFRGVKGVGSAVGADVARESFRKDPILKDNRREEKIANRKYQISNVAPYASYSIQRAFNRLPEVEREVKSVEGQTQIQKKKMSFREFKESNVVQLQKRREMTQSNSSNIKTRENLLQTGSGFKYRPNDSLSMSNTRKTEVAFRKSESFRSNSSPSGYSVESHQRKVPAQKANFRQDNESPKTYRNPRKRSFQQRSQYGFRGEK
jgi:hypothetical protein